MPQAKPFLSFHSWSLLTQSSRYRLFRSLPSSERNLYSLRSRSRILDLDSPMVSACTSNFLHAVEEIQRFNCFCPTFPFLRWVFGSIGSSQYYLFVPNSPVSEQYFGSPWISILSRSSDLVFPSLSACSLSLSKASCVTLAESSLWVTCTARFPVALVALLVSRRDSFCFFGNSFGL